MQERCRVVNYPARWCVATCRTVPETIGRIEIMDSVVIGWQEKRPELPRIILFLSPVPIMTNYSPFVSSRRCSVPSHPGLCAGASEGSRKYYWLQILESSFMVALSI